MRPLGKEAFTSCSRRTDTAEEWMEDLIDSELQSCLNTPSRQVCQAAKVFALAGKT